MKTKEEILFKLKERQELWLTLSYPCCGANELADEIDKLQDAFKKFVRYPEIDKVCHSYSENLEVTRFSDFSSDRRYHLHIHCHFEVNENFFKRKYYISNKKLTALWRKALELDYDPVVDIQVVEGV